MGLLKVQAELEEYRRLMEPPPPEAFEEGFSVRTILGALFVAFVMLPGAAYLSLVTGAGLGSAPQWVTVILYMEVARSRHDEMEGQVEDSVRVQVDVFFHLHRCLLPCLLLLTLALLH